MPERLYQHPGRQHGSHAGVKQRQAELASDTVRHRSQDETPHRAADPDQRNERIRLDQGKSAVERVGHRVHERNEDAEGQHQGRRVENPEGATGQRVADCKARQCGTGRRSAGRRGHEMRGGAPQRQDAERQGQIGKPPVRGLDQGRRR